MDNLNENTLTFPNPPAHYKLFVNSENDLKPPDIEHLHKLEKFICFGNTYSVHIN